jgi:hypothetical protein
VQEDLVLKALFIILLISPVAVAAEQLRDPTTPLGASSQARENTPRLQAILLRNGQRKVIINGELLAEGQSISGFTVERISAQSVQLNSSDGPLLLQLRQKVIN